MFIGNPEEIDPSFQLQLMRRHQFILRGCRRGAVPPPPVPVRAASSLAAAGRQAVVQRIAQRLGSFQDLRAARGQGFLRPLPEQLQPGLPAHLGDAGRARLSPAAHARLGGDGEAARVHHPAGGGAAGLHALRGKQTGGKQCYRLM